MSTTILAEQHHALGGAATEYAEAGRVVFPLALDGKKPRVRWSGLERGDRHVSQVRAWWSQWPTANIGLRTGDGLVVIDVDPRHGGAVDPSWPPTRTSQTRGGGYHLLYRADRVVRNSAGAVAPGIDVRGDGGFIVAPPSPGWSWINDLPIAVAPSCVTSTARRGKGQQDGALPAGWQPFDVLNVVPEGQRNAHLAALTGWLIREGYAGMEIEDTVHAINEAACRPPLPEEEVTGILASIGRYQRS